MTIFDVWEWTVWMFVGIYGFAAYLDGVIGELP